MSDRIYQINWPDFIVHFLPIRWRKTKWIAFQMAIFKPLVELYQNFLSFRKDALYRVNHNSQVCYLRAALNDRFDKAQRRVRIENISRLFPPYIYTPAEERPLYLYTEVENQPIFLYDPETYSDSQVDFIVNVPDDVRPKNPTAQKTFEASIRALVNYYKLASKSYTIQYEIA